MNNQYYQTKESVDEYIKLAEGVNGIQLIEKMRKFLPKHSTLLEIGSGPGTDWNILSNDYNVIGSDNSIEFVNRLKTSYPEGRFLELDARLLNTDIRFDGIYSNKVLHHLKDDEIKASIKRQHEILKPKGVICHSFWKGEGSEIFKGLFVNYHSHDGLLSQFSEYFQILKHKSYKEFEDDDSLVLIGRKKVTDPD